MCGYVCFEGFLNEKNNLEKEKECAAKVEEKFKEK